MIEMQCSKCGRRCLTEQVWWPECDCGGRLIVPRTRKLLASEDEAVGSEKAAS